MSVLPFNLPALPMPSLEVSKTQYEAGFKAAQKGKAREDRSAEKVGPVCAHPPNPISYPVCSLNETSSPGSQGGQNDGSWHWKTTRVRLVPFARRYDRPRNNTSLRSSVSLKRSPYVLVQQRKSRMSRERLLVAKARSTRIGVSGLHGKE